MWEAISSILISSNGLQTILAVLILVLVIIIMVKTGLLHVKTKHLHLGMSSSDKERTIIREQIDWAHTYLLGLEGKIKLVKNGSPQYAGYLTKYVLEVVFDEVVKWITFNNVENSERYISVKADKVCSLVYAQEIGVEFRTKEFNERMKRWTKEVIEKLIEIRELYT